MKVNIKNATFECPHCDHTVVVSITELDVFGASQEICPKCEKIIKFRVDIDLAVEYGGRFEPSSGDVDYEIVPDKGVKS